MLPAQFSESARGKGEVILEAGSFSCLPESLWDSDNVLYHPSFISVFHCEMGEKNPNIFSCPFSVLLCILQALCMLHYFTDVCIQHVAC